MSIKLMKVVVEFNPTLIGFSRILYFMSIVMLGSVYLTTDPLERQINNQF